MTERLRSNHVHGLPDIDDARSQVYASQTAVDNVDLKTDLLVILLDYLNSVYCDALKAAKSQYASYVAQADADRKFIIMVFDVTEENGTSVWCVAVAGIICHLIDHDVDVAGMFRLGKFRADKKNRPILVKLCAAWNKRLIFNRCFKLKHYGQRGAFISLDEPLEDTEEYF
jgi:hypothetical protein